MGKLIWWKKEWRDRRSGEKKRGNSLKKSKACPFRKKRQKGKDLQCAKRRERNLLTASEERKRGKKLVAKRKRDPFAHPEKKRSMGERPSFRPWGEGRTIYITVGKKWNQRLFLLRGAFLSFQKNRGGTLLLLEKEKEGEKEISYPPFFWGGGGEGGVERVYSLQAGGERKGELHP